MHRVVGMASTGCEEGILIKDVACGILVRVVDVVPVRRHTHRSSFKTETSLRSQIPIAPDRC